MLDYQWNRERSPPGKSSRRSPGTTASASPVEACGSQLVHSVSTMFRLIEAAGDDVVGANLTPSHLMSITPIIPS